MLFFAFNGEYLDRNTILNSWLPWKDKLAAGIMEFFYVDP